MEIGTTVLIGVVIAGIVWLLRRVGEFFFHVKYSLEIIVRRRRRRKEVLAAIASGSDLRKARRRTDICPGLQAYAVALELHFSHVTRRGLNERYPLGLTAGVGEVVHEQRFAAQKFLAHPRKKAAVGLGHHLEIRGHAGHGIGLGNDGFTGLEVGMDVGKCGPAFDSCLHFLICSGAEMSGQDNGYEYDAQR